MQTQWNLQATVMKRHHIWMNSKITIYMCSLDMDTKNDTSVSENKEAFKRFPAE
jgi:hypothetical protein